MVKGIALLPLLLMFQWALLIHLYVLLVITLLGLLLVLPRQLAAKRAYKLLVAHRPTTVKEIALHPLLPMFHQEQPIHHYVLLVVIHRGRTIVQ